MSELEMLLQQKKEIETRIKELQAKFIIKSGKLKFEQKESCDNGDRCWQVAYLGTYMKRKYKHEKPYDLISEYESPRWYPFIHEKSKEEAIKAIHEIVTDLQEILQAVDGKENM